MFERNRYSDWLKSLRTFKWLKSLRSHLRNIDWLKCFRVDHARRLSTKLLAKMLLQFSRYVSKHLNGQKSCADFAAFLRGESVFWLVHMMNTAKFACTRDEKREDLTRVGPAGVLHRKRKNGKLARDRHCIKTTTFMLKLTVYNYWRDANNYQHTCFYKIIHFSV